MMLIYEKRERAKEGEDSVNRGFFFLTRFRTTMF